MQINPRLLRLALANPLALSLAVICGATGGGLAVLQAGYLSRVINLVFLEEKALPEVARLLAVLLILILLRSGTAWGLEAAAHAAARSVKGFLRRQMLSHLIALGPVETVGDKPPRERRSGELSHIIVEGLEDLDPYFSQYLPQLALAALVPLTVLAFVFPVDPLSGAVLLLTAPLIPIFMILIGSLSASLTKKQWLALSRMSAYFLDVLQGLTTLKTLGRSREQARVIAAAGERYRQTTMSVLRVTFLSSLTLELAATLSTAVVAVQVGLRLLYGHISFEQAFFVLLLAPEFYLPLRTLGARFHAGMSGAAAAEKIFEILDQRKVEKPFATGVLASNRESAAGEGASALQTGLLEAPPSICFDNVSYTYPDGRQGLTNVSFEIYPGQITALAGPSGAGKSTLACLLLRFIKPGEGAILVDGEPLREIPLAGWRRKTGWSPQNPYLFNDTVAANIRLGKPGAEMSEVIQAAKLANAHQFIQALPGGYETLIGERGARLSGGQAQRMALARAFLINPSFLILDEATSNLDPENEHLLVQAVQRLMAGRTVLVIAHRLATVYQAGRILVFDRGRIVEKGSHAELVRHGGLYRRLVERASGKRVCAAQISPLAGSPRTAAPEGRSSHPGPATMVGNGSSMTAPAGSIKGKMPVFLRLAGLLRPFKLQAALSVLLGFAAAASGMGLMGASAFIIASAALHPSIAELQIAIVGVRFFGISRGVFRYLERYTSHQVAFHLLARLRLWFYEALEPIAPARISYFRSGDLLNRAIGGIASLENFYVRAVAPPLVAVLVAGVAWLYTSGFDTRLGLVLLTFLVAAAAGLPILLLLAARRPGRRLVRERANLSAAVLDLIQGMPDLLAFGQEGRQLARVEAAAGRLAAAQARLEWLAGFQSAFLVLLPNLGMWSVLVLAIPLISDGQIPGVYLAVLAMVALTGFEAMQPLSQAARRMQANLEAAGDLFDLVDAPQPVLDPNEPAPLPQEFSLEVRDVRFRYPSGGGQKDGPFALDGVSFSLPHGKRLAVVGPSGAGKTTLVNLLLRFYEFGRAEKASGSTDGSGEILLGGTDLRCYDQDRLRKAIGVVSQNTYLFTATVRDNLLLARPDAGHEDLRRAARQAHIHDFIQGLPHGYDTWLGEGGYNLSAGERQRLALARALLKDPPLLILDEATANLDPITENEVLQAIRELMAGRTTLTITHRLVGMQWMDEILVLDQGRVAERGRHQELLELGGLYYRMWELQNRALVPG